MMRKRFYTLTTFTLLAMVACGQPDRWQQRVKYTMDIAMNVTTNRFTGKQRLEYTNNSPDTLKKVFYHLYWNAFQPNSMMDNRSRALGLKTTNNGRPDWDPRVKDRIQKLKDDEIGYQKVLSLKMNGIVQKYTVDETILEVPLTVPILPRAKVVFEMEFEAQVPLQIRRSGRDNPGTGVRYSMSQWYPKMCEYDYEGWHPTPYVAREFYGVWGDYEVNITIDKSYMIGGTGYLQNPNQIGFGYQYPGVRMMAPAGPTLTWRFVAPNVHDFMWAADPDYVHLTRTIAGGPVIHVIYNREEDLLRKTYEALPPEKKKNYANADAYIKWFDGEWNRIADAAVTVLPFIEKKFGAYPYKQYTFIHGGDGGMEYPMSTLIVGPSVGTAFHEWMHSWYQGMLGTNESEYAWMDEGFTSYASSLVTNYYQTVSGSQVTESTAGTGPRKKVLVDSLTKSKSYLGAVNPHDDAYDGYYALVGSRMEEPLSTHADHFETNFAYSLAAYSKGEVFMEQLGYVVGAPVRDKILIDYYSQWRFKHPNVNDFIRVAEKASDMKLDWYREYFVNTTKTIDYGIDSLWEEGGKTKIRIRRIGNMPMPIDVLVSFKDGSKLMAYVPMYLMFGAKPVEDAAIPRNVYEPWKWTHPQYTFEINHKITDLKIIEIDPSLRMADVDRKNNKLDIPW